MSATKTAAKPSSAGRSYARHAPVDLPRQGLVHRSLVRPLKARDMILLFARTYKPFREGFRAPLVLLLAALASPGVAQTKGDALESVTTIKAKAAVVRTLKDPESVRFRDLSERPDKDALNRPTIVVCGMVNAKNSYGGYIGFRPFAYLASTGELMIYSDDPTAGATLSVRRRCPLISQ